MAPISFSWGLASVPHLDVRQVPRVQTACYTPRSQNSWLGAGFLSEGRHCLQYGLPFDLRDCMSDVPSGEPESGTQLSRCGNLPTPSPPILPTALTELICQNQSLNGFRCLSTSLQGHTWPPSGTLCQPADRPQLGSLTGVCQVCRNKGGINKCRRLFSPRCSNA